VSSGRARDDLATAVESSLRHQPAWSRASVAQLERLSGGASRETWSVVLSSGDQLILQRARQGAVGAGPGMEVEARLIAAAADAGVAVPDVVSAGGPDAGLGAAYMITRVVPGETIARRILRDDEYEVSRTVLSRQMGAALAGVHRIPVDAFPELAGDDQLRQYRELVELLAVPMPAFELGLRWLEDHRPAPAGACVVHGDFRIGNLIVDGDGLAAVIDWELAHRGDPAEDLGWPCVRAWRFGGTKPVAGIGEYAELLAGYEEAGGAPVDRDALRWWEVMGTLKWGVMCLVQAESHLSGATRSVELATIGRRVCENEYDVLRLLGVDVPAPTSAGSEDAAGRGSQTDELYGRPSASALVQAVREYVDGDVRENTTGRTSFHARVAVNALAMVERELALGPSQRAAHQQRLEALGLTSERELAAAIRAGDLDDRWDEVTAAVAATVADKLAVANPTWFE
jgi:aminoglycoside phosphotransferase (APT) family kinase protein